MQIVHSIDKLGIWHRLPVILGLFYLGIRRHLHQEYNLFNVGKTPVGVRFNPADYPYRTADGQFNDPFNEGAGSQGTFFGRNVLPVDQTEKVYMLLILPSKKEGKGVTRSLSILLTTNRFCKNFIGLICCF